MNTMPAAPPLTALESCARSGLPCAVDHLMSHVHTASPFRLLKMVDYTLGLVDSVEGCARLRHYLFCGEVMQRNYAALYFKRRGMTELLQEAVDMGCIDPVQAFSR